MLPLDGKGKTFDQEVTRVLTKIEEYDPESEQYKAAVQNLKTLCEARAQKSSKTITADTVLLVAANLIGILLVLNYERMDVVTSKAMNFIIKSK